MSAARRESQEDPQSNEGDVSFNLGEEAQGNIASNEDNASLNVTQEQDDEPLDTVTEEAVDDPLVPEGEPSRPTSQEDRKKRYVDALKDVCQGMTIRGAAKKYGISYSALAVHVKNKSKPPTKTGRQPFLSEEDEAQLVEWCLGMAKIGCPQRKSSFPLVVQSILKSKKKMVFPPDNLPTPGWVYKFLQRHPELSSRIPEHLGHLRASVSYQGVMGFF